MKVNSSWSRTALAIVAAIAVVAPSMVKAAGPGVTSYAAPRYARIVGPAAVTHSTSVGYEAFIAYTDGSSATFSGAPVVFTANKGSFSGSTYTAPANTGLDMLHVQYSNGGFSVFANRVITIQ